MSSLTAPKVSVIMPSLNVAPYIRQCIESVVRQTLRDIEIICVDAGSTDGTFEILREYAEKDSRITLLRSDKKSYGYQMNMGIDAARGEYIGIVETDDWIDDNMYECLWNAASENDADIVKARYYAYRTSPSEQSSECDSMRGCEYDRVLTAAEIPAIFTASPSIWSAVYRTEMLRDKAIRLHESPGASYQDTSFFFITSVAAERYLLLKNCFYRYRCDNEGSSVKSQAKLYCLHDEMRFCDAYLDAHPELKAVYARHLAVFRFSKYRWNYSRVAARYQWELTEQMHDEFLETDRAGMIDRALFDDTAWRRLRELIDAPVRFYADTCKLYSARPRLSAVYPPAVLRRAASAEPAVSVIIPAYNAEKYIGATLDSVAGQTLGDIEIVCIDDGSTDGTLDAILAFADKDDRLTVLAQCNKGQSAARNAGLAVARGRYIHFLDSDDLMTPNAYELLLNTAVERETDLLCFDAEAFYDSKELEAGYPAFMKLYAFDEDVPHTTGAELFHRMKKAGKYRPSPCLAFTRRAYLEGIGLKFEEGLLHEDNLFTFICMLSCDSAAHIKDALLRRRVREGSVMTSPKSFFNFYGYLACYIGMLEFSLRIVDDETLATDAASELRTVGRVICDLYEAAPDSASYTGRLTGPERELLRMLIAVNRRAPVSSPSAAPRGRLYRAVTFVPRKIAGGVRCCREHGVRYTARLMLKKLGLAGR